MSTLKVDTIQDTNAVEMYLCKAWVNFDGTQTAANMIRDSGNVSSITDLSTGQYRINLSNAMTDADYALSVNTGGSGATYWHYLNYLEAPTTSTFKILINNSANTAQVDPVYVYVAVFR